jgi:hypothetical protein
MSGKELKALISDTSTVYLMDGAGDLVEAAASDFETDSDGDFIIGGESDEEEDEDVLDDDDFEDEDDPEAEQIL